MPMLNHVWMIQAQPMSTEIHPYPLFVMLIP